MMFFSQNLGLYHRCKSQVSTADDTHSSKPNKMVIKSFLFYMLFKYSPFRQFLNEMTVYYYYPTIISDLVAPCRPLHDSRTLVSIHPKPFWYYVLSK